MRFDSFPKLSIIEKLQEKQIKTKGTVNSIIEKPHSNHLIIENNKSFPKQSDPKGLQISMKITNHEDIKGVNIYFWFTTKQ